MDYNNEREIWIEIDDDNLLLLAEMIADDSTIRDRQALYKKYPGAWDCEDVYEHQFGADYNIVHRFADTHNLSIDILEA